MLDRFIEKSVRSALCKNPAAALLGPRQVGKTTLARKIAEGVPSVYLDLESPADLLKLTDPLAFFELHQDKLIVIDEIQRQPELFMTMRGVIDKNRACGCETGQFLVLGSASMDLLRQSSESLAGRITYVNMGGLNGLEVVPDSTHWLRGGFPGSYLAPSEGSAMDWLEDLIQTYLERDVPQMGFRVPSGRLRRLWTMLAHLQGETVNMNTLAGNLEVSRSVIGHYLDILTDLLLVRRLSPWHENVKKRLIKSPRYYIRDSGIHHRLLGIDNHMALLSHPTLGKSWEGYVIENIHTVLPRRAETYFYCTSAGAKIDLVIKLPGAQVWAIEIKHGLAPKIGRHYAQTSDDVGATHKYVVYGGNDEFPIGNGVTMISLGALLNKISVV